MCFSSWAGCGDKQGLTGGTFDHSLARRAPAAALGAGDVSALGTTEKLTFMSKRLLNKILSLFRELE